MENIVVLQPDGKLKVIRAEDFCNPEHRLDAYVGPVGHKETIQKGKEIALETHKIQKER